MRGWSRADIPAQQPRRALVTGAASGLGYACAVALAAAGAEVTLVDRNREGGAAAVRRIQTEQRDARVRFLSLDLGDLAAIAGFADQLNAEAQPLDILINNAGLLPLLQRATTRDGFEMKFGVSHLGHFALTGRLLPSLLRSAQARVVSVSSIVSRRAHIDFDDLQARRHYEGQRAYSQTKLACLMFALELQQRAKAADWPLLSIAAHPGIARTALGDQRMAQQALRLRDRAEAWAYQFVMRFLSQSSEHGALPLLYAATAPQAQGGEFYGPRGFGEFRGAPKRVAIPATALNTADRQRLWSVSEQLTGVIYR